MVRRLALLALAILGGCYVSHARDALDAGTDASVIRIDAAREDAPPVVPRDVGTDAFTAPDAMCSELEERSLRFCVLTPSGTIPEGSPFALPVERSMCLCEQRVCDVAIGERRIDLTLRTCDVDVVCAECTSEATCALPPLPRGTYEVRVGGLYSGTVEVAPPEMVREARPSCWAIPDPPDESLLCAGNVTARPGPGQMCHRALEDVGAAARFSVTFECGGCFDWSAGCEARRESADTILLRPRVQACDCPECGACDPAVCFPQTVVCETPSLRDGDYEIVVERAPGERLSVSSLAVRDITTPGPPVCVPVPE